MSEGKRPNSEPCKWQTSMQRKWMHEETLRYCTVKSINLSERSQGLLAGINHTETQIKIQGTGWQGERKKLFLLRLSVSSNCGAHICPVTRKKILWLRCLSQVCGSCSHGKSRCYFFYFLRGSLDYFFFSSGCVSFFYVAVFCRTSRWNLTRFCLPSLVHTYHLV